MMRPRLSIRAKTLIAISIVLFAAMGTYLYLATSLFTRDKLAYVYDLNAALVKTLSEQTRLELSLVGEKLTLFTAASFAPGRTPEQREQLADAWLRHEGDVVRIEIHEQDAGGYRRVLARVNRELLRELGLSLDDLERVRLDRPIPLEVVAAKGVHVQNSSLPPDVPLLTVAVPVPGPLASVGRVALVDFRQSRLLRILGRSAIYTTYLVDGVGEVLAHPDSERVVAHARLGEREVVRAALEGAVDRGVREFTAPDGEVMIGSYARVGTAATAVVAELPRSEALRPARELVRRSALFGIAILVVAFIASVFFSRRLTQPLRQLRDATGAIGRGDFNLDIKVTSTDEIGELATAFKGMVREIREKQQLLLQSEKMAAFGQLGAGMTHEVKNPLAGIIGFTQYAQRRVDDAQKVKEYLGFIEAEAKRCTDIVDRFLRFARSDRTEFVEVDVNGVVPEAMRIVEHQMMMHGIRLSFDPGTDLPRVMADPAHLQQVLLNLLLNAEQAMPSGGAVRIETRADPSGWVLIRVNDNGPGVPDDLRSRIFEPFFTTKKPGEGTGLGLAVSYGIVRDHGGGIAVEKNADGGATFAVRLPALGRGLRGRDAAPEKTVAEDEPPEKATTAKAAG